MCVYFNTCDVLINWKPGKRMATSLTQNRYMKNVINYSHLKKKWEIEDRQQKTRISYKRHITFDWTTSYGNILANGFRNTDTIYLPVLRCHFHVHNKFYGGISYSCMLLCRFISAHWSTFTWNETPKESRPSTGSSTLPLTNDFLTWLFSVFVSLGSMYEFKMRFFYFMQLLCECECDFNALLFFSSRFQFNKTPTKTWARVWYWCCWNHSSITKLVPVLFI